MRRKRIRPMGINRINLLLKDLNGNYQLEKTEEGEIIMSKISDSNDE